MARQWGSAWRVFAALPFVLLCAILAVKVGNAGTDPTAAVDTSTPSAQLTQDLGDDAPDADVRVTPGASGATGSVTDLPTDLLTSAGETMLPTASPSTDDAESVEPSPTRSSSTPKPSPTRVTQSSTPTPTPTTQSPTPTPSAPSEQACRDKYDGLQELQCLKLFP